VRDEEVFAISNPNLKSLGALPNLAVQTLTFQRIRSAILSDLCDFAVNLHETCSSQDGEKEN
jgi:hypothetical protein